MVYTIAVVINMKMHIKEFATYSGVSVRTLHYYDEIGLLKPSYTDPCNGYRFYDESALFRLQEILFYRELDFSLKSIGEILSNPNYNKESALLEQKQLLILKKERLENLIDAIDGAIKGENIMSAFSNNKFEQYKTEAKEKWGNTAAYKECEEKAPSRKLDIGAQFSDVFVRIGAYKHMSPDATEVQNMVRELQQFITDNFYHCTKEILSGLGEMYIADERFTANIDSAAGEGTAAFVSEAILIYCK